MHYKLKILLLSITAQLLQLEWKVFI